MACPHYCSYSAPPQPPTINLFLPIPDLLFTIIERDQHLLVADLPLMVNRRSQIGVVAGRLNWIISILYSGYTGLINLPAEVRRVSKNLLFGLRPQDRFSLTLPSSADRFIPNRQKEELVPCTTRWWHCPCWPWTCFFPPPAPSLPPDQSPPCSSSP